MGDFPQTIPRHRGCVALSIALATCMHAAAAEISLAPSNMPRVATIDERFQSYNIEMVEVTGGAFWKPYGAPGNGLFSERRPKDLGHARLRKLAAALSPAYVRISGTWANTTYVAETDGAPPGF